MSEGSGGFKAGVAIAADILRFYDSVYTERFMRTPKENGDGYQASSAINRASKLKGKLLLIHGSGDYNVHLQNFMGNIVNNGTGQTSSLTRRLTPTGTTVSSEEIPYMY